MGSIRTNDLLCDCPLSCVRNVCAFGVLFVCLRRVLSYRIVVCVPSSNVVWVQHAVRILIVCYATMCVDENVDVDTAHDVC